MAEEKLIEEASAFITKNFFWLNDEVQNVCLQPAAAFAEQQVRAERERIAEDLLWIVDKNANSFMQFTESVVDYIAKLKGGE